VIRPCGATVTHRQDGGWWLVSLPLVGFPCATERHLKAPMHNGALRPLPLALPGNPQNGLHCARTHRGHSGRPGAGWARAQRRTVKHRPRRWWPDGATAQGRKLPQTCAPVNQARPGPHPPAQPQPRGDDPGVATFPREGRWQVPAPSVLLAATAPNLTPRGPGVTRKVLRTQDGRRFAPLRITAGVPPALASHEWEPEGLAATIAR
jgi:hypothetical protein